MNTTKVIARNTRYPRIIIITEIHDDFPAEDDNARIEEAYRELSRLFIFSVLTLMDYKVEFDFSFE